jgi:hypothetical protein
MKRKIRRIKISNIPRDVAPIYLSLADYRQVLVDFANTDTTREAESVLSGLKCYFKFDGPDPKGIKGTRAKLRKLFDEIARSGDLSQSETIDDYTIDYHNIRPPIDVQDDGILAETPLLHKNEPLTFWDVLNYCVVKFASDERSLKLFYKCEGEKCGKYFFAKRVKKRGKGGIRFCSSKCRLDFHNRKRIETGAHAAYKRRRRAEGAPESYYG